MKKKIAIITGVTGQDGSYLAELLLSKNYIVHGLKRRTSIINTSRVDHLYENQKKLKNKSFFLHYADLTDVSSIMYIVKSVKPDEIYNLAAQSHVQASFENPEYTSNVNALGTLRILEAIRIFNKKIKFYQASSSEMFGKIQERMQDENTKFYPLSPYATSKLFGYWITKNYRESYGIYACNGILFNHESPRRGETFVTRKITIGLTKICKGFSKILELGNLDSLRDWGHTKDFVEMQWRMLQQKKPKDYVIATGKQISVRKFIEIACIKLGFEIKWKYNKLKEVGYVNKIKKNYGYSIKKNQVIIKVNKKYFRPNEVNNLLGNAKLASKELGWKSKINVKQLIDEMIKHDMQSYT